MQSVVRKVVVIGSGLAGYAVLRELRRLDASVHLTLLTADDGCFYSKPALSTALAKGKTAETLVTMSAERMTSQLRLDLHAGCTVLGIDRAARRVKTNQGDFTFDALVLALGADPIRPPLEGDAADAALAVNSLADYARLRTMLPQAARVLIMGAGLVGSEFANDLAASGHRPLVVDPLAHPLAQLAPAKVGDAVRAALAAAGVEWRLGQRVSALNHAGRGYLATLSDGSDVAADIVLSAVGLRPHTALARAAGLAVDHGVKVDDTGATSDPAIFAIGDCAHYPAGPAAYVTPIMSVARAVAQGALGTPTPIRFPPLSVQIKTTACPIALLPPPRDAGGDWTLVADDATGMKFVFLAPNGQTLGYVLTQGRCDERVDIDREIAAGQGWEVAA